MTVLKKMFEIKFVYVTVDIAMAGIKNYIYHYTAPCEMVICDGGGLTGNHISH
jgi:hypothetical protein